MELLERAQLDEETERYLAFIRNRVDALRQLTEELFRYSVFASVEEMQPERLALNRALEESLLSYYGAFSEKGIRPELDLPQEDVFRTLDPKLLGRVFGNILQNALKYSGGDLHVSMTQDGKITFSNAAPNLTPVAVARMFDRFYTVESARGSTGLGLAIAKLLTLRMGGDISAEYCDGVLFTHLKF